MGFLDEWWVYLEGTVKFFLGGLGGIFDGLRN